MALALALLLASLDGGRHGDAFALHGVAVPVWEQYRRYDGAPDFPVVQLQADGGALQFVEVRQGCNADGGGCMFEAPGVFISRAPGVISPAYSPVWLSDVQPTDRTFDVRFALLEAAPDGGLQNFVVQAGGDNGPEMDPYFSPGVDGLVVHATIQADSTNRRGQFVDATCTTGGSTLREEARTNRVAEGSSASIAIPSGAQFSWGLVDAGSGDVAFSVFANRVQVWRWEFPQARLTQCGNADDGGYSDGQLSLSRLVPVLYVGWATFRPPAQNATFTMGFGGHGPQFGAMPSISTVGQRVDVPVRLIDGEGRVVLGVPTRVDVSLAGPQPFPAASVLPGLTPSGEAFVSFTPTTPQVVRITLQVDNAFVAVERTISIVSSMADAGLVDAGAADAGSVDAGSVDAGSVDAGSVDAGSVDAGSVDAGSVDAGSVDAG
ncbi:MAG: hypothetical protein GQE15_39935, partial [Archangiaceae bacterium]|nr:hypothetical protein [Archangiaceae bacterium]